MHDLRYSGRSSADAAARLQGERLQPSRVRRRRLRADARFLRRPARPADRARRPEGEAVPAPPRRRLVHPAEEPGAPPTCSGAGVANLATARRTRPSGASVWASARRNSAHSVGYAANSAWAPARNCPSQPGTSFSIATYLTNAGTSAPAKAVGRHPAVGIMQSAHNQFMIHQPHAALHDVDGIGPLRDDLLPVLPPGVLRLDCDNAPARSIKRRQEIEQAAVAAHIPIGGIEIFDQRHWG